MRICFLALQAPDLSPSQRYRFEAFMPGFQKRGFDVSYDWLLDKDDLRIFYGHESLAKKGLVGAKALVRRAASIVKHRDVDVYFVQREAFFLFNQWSEWLAHVRAPVVFDFDDAIWIHSVSQANRRLAWLKNVNKISGIASLAHTVLAGNDYLANWARAYSNNVHVVPTCVDTQRFSPGAARPNTGPVTIGWSGSPSTFSHLKPLLPVLERIKARFQDRVRFRVMGDPSFQYAPLNLQGEAWAPHAELSLLQEMNIGLMPLPDDQWTRGKCGLKGLVSMSVGAATVMSPVGVNNEIVSHGENGFLAHSDDEWVDILSRLIDDATLRHRIGEAGRETVVQRYSVAAWQQPLETLLMKARSH
jgi:glycosyltransferase involved in cell wall biosynthesis